MSESKADTPDEGLTERERQSLIDAMDAVIEAGWTGLTPQHVGPVVERIVAARVAAERERILRETADSWTQGEWSDVMLPKPTPPAVPVIAYANRVGDWLYDRAAALGGDES